MRYNHFDAVDMSDYIVTFIKNPDSLAAKKAQEQREKGKIMIDLYEKAVNQKKDSQMRFIKACQEYFGTVE